MFRKSITVLGVSLVLLLLLLGWFSHLSASSNTAKPGTAQSGSQAIAQIVPDELEPSIRVGNQRISTKNGQPLVLYAVNFPVDPGTPEEMAQQYLRENAAILHLQSPDLGDLEHTFTRRGPSGPTVRFRQVANGIPVYKSDVVVHLNNQHTVTYVANDYKSALAIPANSSPALTAVDATQVVRDYLGIIGKSRLEKSALMWYFLQSQTYLVYRVNIVTNEPLGDWEAMVDANSGELLKLVNQSLDYGPENEGEGTGTAVSNSSLVTGTGNVFDPDPLSSANATYGDPGFTDNNDATSPQLDGELMSVTLQDITFTGGMYHLDGTYAAIRDTETPFKGLFSQAINVWNYNRFDDAFEAANTYYHIDSSMRYLNETLGLGIMPYQYSGGVRFDPHGLNGADNSHYSTGSGEVAFGEGGVDDAEDSDVIHHELGHGLHDWVTNGGLSQVNGLSEGTGDYWAQSYNRSLGYWQPTDPPYQWVFIWDGHNPFWPGRVTNYPAVYPGGLTGQIHTDGQIWSTCNMRVYDEIGKQQIDRAMWEGLGMTNSSTNQEDAANAVYQAAIDMGYSTAELQDMHDIYLTCVYVVPDVPSGVGVTLSPDQADSGTAGSTVTYTVGITNTGIMTDTFDLTVSGNTWTTTPSTSSVTLNVAESTSISVVVDIPGSAGDGDTDTATVTATSQADPDVSDSTDLTTTAVGIPIIDVAPAAINSVQAPDTVDSQTLTIGNLGTGTLDWIITETAAALVNGSSILATPHQIDRVGNAGEPDTSVAAPRSILPSTGEGLVQGNFSEGFDDITTLPGDGWAQINNSAPLGTTGWFQGNDAVFPAQTGAPTSYIGANYNNTAGTGTISNWLLTPEINLSDGSTLTFYTRTPAASIWPDRLEVRMSTAGSSVDVGTTATSVGDFTNLLLEINPTLAQGGYPETWTQFTVTLSGVGTPTTGRLALRYFVTDAGPTGNNSNYIGIDTVEYTYVTIQGPCDTPSDVPWLSVSPGSGSTAGGASSEVTVTFDSTGLTAGNTYTATLCVSSNDPVTPLVTVPVTMTVITPTYGVALSGDQALSGDVGTTVTYTLSVTNNGDVDDVIDLTAVSANGWSYTLSTSSVSLNAYESVDFTVTVDVPAGAGDGDMDDVTVTATSQGNSSATDTAVLTTTAVSPVSFIYLPIILKP